MDSENRGNNEYEDVCMICRRSESTAGKMFHLPGNMTICNDCMHKTLEGASQMGYGDFMNSPFFQNMTGFP